MAVLTGWRGTTGLVGVLGRTYAKRSWDCRGVGAEVVDLSLGISGTPG